MALGASRITVQAEAEQREMDDEERESQLVEAEERRKALLQELDVLNNAIQHRLVRWAASLPERALADQLWPQTYSTDEKKAIRGYFKEYVREHGLLESELDEQELVDVIDAIKEDDAFPVELARSASVIQAVLLEFRGKEAQRARSQSTAATPSASRSRSVSPVKRGRGGRQGASATRGRTRRRSGRAELSEDDDDDAEDEEEGITAPRGKKRPRRDIATASYVLDDADAAAAEDEDDSDVYRDYQKQSRKRARMRTSKVTQFARHLAEEDEDEADEEEGEMLM